MPVAARPHSVLIMFVFTTILVPRRAPLSQHACLFLTSLFLLFRLTTAKQKQKSVSHSAQSTSTAGSGDDLCGLNCTSHLCDLSAETQLCSDLSPYSLLLQSSVLRLFMCLFVNLWLDWVRAHCEQAFEKLDKIWFFFLLFYFIEVVLENMPISFLAVKQGVRPGDEFHFHIFH